MFEGLFIWRNGCKDEWMCLDEGCIEMGMNDQSKTNSMAATHTSFYRGSARQGRLIGGVCNNSRVKMK